MVEDMRGASILAVVGGWRMHRGSRGRPKSLGGWVSNVAVCISRESEVGCHLVVFGAQ